MKQVKKITGGLDCSRVIQSKNYRLLSAILGLLIVAYIIYKLQPSATKHLNSRTHSKKALHIDHVGHHMRHHMTKPITSAVAPIIEPSTVSPKRTIPAGSAIRIDRKRYVCPSFGPNLGNLMFLYASNYGVAFDNNMTVALTTYRPIYDPFLLPKPVTKGILAKCLTARTLRQSEPRIYEKFIIPKKGNIRLDGYLESWKYFANSFEDLRSQFTFRPKYANRAEKTIKKIITMAYPDVNNRDVTTVGIHVRRGDKLTEGLPLASKEYIEEAKQYFLNRFRNVVFIVSSTQDNESKTWCKKNVIEKSGISMFTNTDCKFVDMAILSKCDHIIISVGTYSWWSGFLNRGTVFFYDHYSPKIREDFILPTWIGIKANSSGT